MCKRHAIWKGGAGLIAQRRMFSKDITENDAFLDMPLSTQALYFHLGMQADDDGFVSPKRIVRMLGCQSDDLKILIAKKFVISFEDGVVVIKHWKINNYLRNDRHKPTTYQDKLALLTTKSNGGYKLDTNGIPLVDAGKDSIGKVRLGKVRLNKREKSGRFTPPTLEELKNYIKEKNYQNVNAERFYNFYDSKGWMVGKNKMKNWRSAIAGWESRNKSEQSEDDYIQQLKERYGQFK